MTVVAANARRHIDRSARPPQTVLELFPSHLVSLEAFDTTRAIAASRRIACLLTPRLWIDR
jgi:hypothetical protein